MFCFQWSGFVSVVWFCFGGMILFQWYDLVSVVCCCFSGMFLFQWYDFVSVVFLLLGGMFVFSVVCFVFSVVCCFCVAGPGFEIDRKRSMFSTDSEIRMHDGKPMCSQSVYFHWFFNRKWSGEVLNR